VGGPGWDNGGTHSLKDSDVTILHPGEKVEFSFDDISGAYIFQRGGRHLITLAYAYAPPRFESTTGVTMDGLGHPYDLADLSPENSEALKHATWINVVSNQAVVTVVP
jgi:hypothetical protein